MPHPSHQGRRADWLFVFFVMLLVLGLGAILGTCVDTVHAQCQNPYCPGGTAVRVYDGGTGAHDAFNARRNLGITAGALTGLRDSLSSLYYSAIQDPLLRVKDSQFWVKDDSDTTKKFQFEANGISTGTTRTYTMPNTTGNVPLLETANTWVATNIFGGSGSAFRILNSGGGAATTIATSCVTDQTNTFPNTSGSILIHGATQPIGSKTIYTTNTINARDDRWTVGDDADTTKKIALQSSGISTGTTRTYTGPNKNGTLALLEDLTGGGTAVYDPLLRVKDADFFIKDNGDTTKKLQFELSNLTTATTRTDSVPDISSLLAAARHTNTFSRQQTFTSNTDEALVVLNGSSANTIPAFQVFDETSNYLAYIDNGGFVAGVGGFGIINALTGDFVQVTNKSAIGVSRSYKIDNTITGTPDFVMTSGTQTISGAKTTNGSFVMNAGRTAGRWPLFVDGTAARVSFADQADSSKKWAYDISGFTTATTRKLTPPNYTGGMPLVGLNTGAAAAGEIGKRNLTAQTAAIGSTNLTSSALTGIYVIEYYLEDTTADATAGTIQFQVNYTDDVGATTQTSAALALTATGRTFGTLVAYLNSGELSYQTNLVGIIGTSQYALRFRVTYKG